MPVELSTPEKEHLRLIADALARKEVIATDDALVSALIRKCMLRTNGKELRLTEMGRRQLAN